MYEYGRMSPISHSKSKQGKKKQETKWVFFLIKKKKERLIRSNKEDSLKKLFNVIIITCIDLTALGYGHVCKLRFCKKI